MKVLKSYEAGKLNNHHGGAILLGDYLYFGHGENNGIPAFFQFETGELIWKAKKRLPEGGGSSAWLYADGLLYIRYDNGLLALVKPSPVEKEFRVVSSFMLPAADEAGHEQGWPVGPGDRQWPTLHPRSTRHVLLRRQKQVGGSTEAPSQF